MSVILPMLAATMLITAQALWKKAFSGIVMSLSLNFFFSKTFLSLLFSPTFIAGAIMYLATTFFYLYLFNRFSFYSVQSIILVTAITLSFLLSIIIFKESFTLYKLAGLALLISGIVLIYKK